MTAEARVQSQASSCEIVVNKVVFRQVSLPVLEFHPVCIIPPMLSSSYTRKPGDLLKNVAFWKLRYFKKGVYWLAFQAS